jgi:NTP pyrophosphatase (non-canonical NTP hydrolase)
MNTYYIYHIPGKKVGVTRNLNDRVTTQQGYKVTEYEVLDSSTDIDYISKREIELQQSYGYRVDRKLYKNLFNNMNINATEQTSTFPFPMEELKERLNNNLGQTWDTLHGTFELTKETIEWIVVNAKTSMYNELRSYVYNKAFFEKFLNKTKSNIEKVKKSVEEGFVLHKQLTNNADRFKLIREWAKERGLYAKGDTKTQFCKLMEEAGELGRAILKDDKPEFVDAIGDMIVVLTNLAHLGGFSIEHCIDSAYDEIKNRKGNMKNGTFVKS